MAEILDPLDFWTS